MAVVMFMIAIVCAVVLVWMAGSIVLQNKELTNKALKSEAKRNRAIGAIRQERNSPLVSQDTVMVLDSILVELEKDN